MLDEKDFSLRVGKLLDDMRRAPNAGEIEKAKKIVKKNVGLFERTSLLSYLMLDVCVGQDNRQRHAHAPSVRSGQDRQSAEPGKVQVSDKVTMWCSACFRSQEDVDAFFGFVCGETGVPRSDISDYRRKGKFSFFCVGKENAQKIVDRFDKPSLFNSMKFSIRYGRTERK